MGGEHTSGRESVSDARLRGGARPPRRSGCGVRPRLGGSPPSGLRAGTLVGAAEVVHGKFLELGPWRRESRVGAPPEVAPPLVWARAGWGWQEEPAGPVAPGSVHGRGRARVRPRVAREALRRDAGECIGGRSGGGGFSRKRAIPVLDWHLPPRGRWRALATPTG